MVYFVIVFLILWHKCFSMDSIQHNQQHRDEVSTIVMHFHFALNIPSLTGNFFKIKSRFCNE